MSTKERNLSNVIPVQKHCVLSWTPGILVVLNATELYGTLVRNTCVTCCRRRRRCACVVFVCLFVCLFVLVITAAAVKLLTKKILPCVCNGII